MSRTRLWASLGFAGGFGLLAAFAGGCYLGLSQADAVGGGGEGGVHSTGTVSGGGSGEGGDTLAGGGGASEGGNAAGGSGGFGGAGGDVGGQGGAVATVVPDFGLQDVNATSTSYGQSVSPRDYLDQVSAWYFGHAT